MKINFKQRYDGKFNVYNSKKFTSDNLLWSSDSLNPNQQFNYLEIDYDGNLAGYNGDGIRVWQVVPFEERQATDEDSVYYLELNGNRLLILIFKF